jgi:predicted class III extradiol MEMO1 family dioxygenase
VLDREGMAAIESGVADAFRQYLKETQNTICGRNPISVLLQVIVMPTLFYFLFLVFCFFSNFSPPIV